MKEIHLPIVLTIKILKIENVEKYSKNLIKINTINNGTK